MAFESEVYIAKYLKTITDDYGIEKDLFDTPQKFSINHQPISGEMAYQEYGDDKNSVRRAYPPLEYVGGKIHCKDRAYLIDGDNYGTDLKEVALNDNETCDEANYEVIVTLPSRLRMQIDFKKIK